MDNNVICPFGKQYGKDWSPTNTDCAACREYAYCEVKYKSESDEKSLDPGVPGAEFTVHMNALTKAVETYSELLEQQMKLSTLIRSLKAALAECDHIKTLSPKAKENFMKTLDAIKV